MASRNDRVEGVLLATSAGDALGAPYEFKPPRGPELAVEMAGGGGWEPGEWTDDTAMALAIAEVAATGVDLCDPSAQDRIVNRWYAWSLGAKDVGIQTRSVLREAAQQNLTASDARAAAAEVHRHTGRSAGNGSLMRTAPVALAYLDDEAGMVAAARALSELTHFDPEAGDACVLWCSAIRHAVHTGQLDARIGLHHIDSERGELWSQRLDEAERLQPADFPHNGWVVSALQAAWSAIANTQGHSGSAQHLRVAIDAAVRAGDDTDTVAAIAGGLLGGAYGASAVPLEWRRKLHGWPDLNARGVVALANAIERKGKPNRFDGAYHGYRVGARVPHPYDDKVLLGGIGALRSLPDGVDAVVSLCRIGDSDVPERIPHVEVRLIDSSEPDDNPHLDFVLEEAARAVEELRGEGRTVLLHCVEAFSRTPTVAALYGARLRGIGAVDVLDDVLAALPDADPNPAFREALGRMGGGGGQ